MLLDCFQRYAGHTLDFNLYVRLSATLPTRKKYGSLRSPGKHRDKNVDLIDEVRGIKHI
jgi:hypothetical protein